MLGTIIIYAAFAAATAAVCLYYFSTLNKKFLFHARLSFYISATCIASASALLMVYILQHRFEYYYIANYSSINLPIELLITAFWAGQEGSFLLWALFASITGLFFRVYARKIRSESESMAVYSLIPAFLSLLIAADSPFRYLWNVQPGIPDGFVPADGLGLNPVLQNFWMIIHPPVLFLGFAILAVPFVLAVTSLWRRKYNQWIETALPWVILGSASLGAGLILGGYWAYGVLGWGGWWGWDPVENSSLVPWILTIVLIHTMIIQKRTGRMMRTNLIIAMLTYLLVIYSTFLTRSGVLANVSVHSFMDSGSEIHALLLVWMFIFSSAGIIMFLLRRKEFRNKIYTGPLFTREFLMTCAAVAVGTSAAVIIFGTSLPVFSDMTVDLSFFEKTNFPLSVLILLLLGLSLSAQWKRQKGMKFLRGLFIPAIAALLTAAAMFAFGLREVSPVILACASSFCFITAVIRGYRDFKEIPFSAGTAISHAGLALLFLGILGSGEYSQTLPVSLPVNEKVQIFGYDLTYKGSTASPDGREALTVIVGEGENNYALEPAITESRNGLMRSPDFLSSWREDLYIEPISVKMDMPATGNSITLIKGEPLIYGPMTIVFKRFDFGAEENDGIIGSSNSFTVGAIIQVCHGRDTQYVVPSTTFFLENGRTRTDMKTAYTKGGENGFRLVSIDVSRESQESRIEINITGTKNNSDDVSKKMKETLIAEVSLKPFMILVWFGAFMILGGSAVSAVRRFRRDGQKRG
jgi:cytochrome c-type biogenesis protein CcmF